MKELVYEAMQFARHAHAGQKRKYTAEPYSGHLAEVAGIVASVTDDPEVLATAWLHDAVEDQHVDLRIIAQRFGRSWRKASQHFPMSRKMIMRSRRQPRVSGCTGRNRGSRRSRLPI